MSERYIKDGKVAVLYSPGFGSGWYSWNTDFPDILFDPEIVEPVLRSDFEAVTQITERKYPDIYLGSNVETLTVEWLAPGTAFRINEYDGAECVQTLDSLTLVA